MKRILFLSVSIIMLLGSSSVFAAISDSDLGFLPPAHDLFKPLQADPRELQYALRVVAPISRKILGEAAIGDYIGLYRWSILDGKALLQVSGGGGAFGRFDLASEANDLQIVDFYGNVPFDVKMGKWSGRFMLYHTSSHLGDDFIKTTGETATKHSWDNLRILNSYDFNSYFRTYAGYTYVFRELPEHLGRNAIQGGLETSTPWFWKGHTRAYWANDFQTWERSAWKLMYDSQLGLRFAKTPDPSARSTSVFIEFETGPQPQGQFFQQDERRWNFGVKFELG